MELAIQNQKNECAKIKVKKEQVGGEERMKEKL